MMVYSWQKLATLVVIMLSSQLAGCAYYSNNSRNCIDYLGRNTCETLELDPQEAMMSQPVYSSEGLRTQYSHKHLSHYVEQMTMKMIDKKSIEIISPIAVASFVHFDSTLNRSNILGNQLAETFIHELQAYSLPVVDYKLTGAIRITPRGDFAFSRDVEELVENQSIGYILSGTMTQAQGGVVVNARIIGLSSKVVVASTQAFIPGFVLNAIYPNPASSD